jgi:tRNA (guanine37-N1)-methyltransferase
LRGRKVPKVLTSGHHKNIQVWRKEMSVEITKKNRPDLLQ